VGFATSVTRLCVAALLWRLDAAAADHQLWPASHSEDALSRARVRTIPNPNPNPSKGACHPPQRCLEHGGAASPSDAWNTEALLHPAMLGTRRRCFTHFGAAAPCAPLAAAPLALSTSHISTQVCARAHAQRQATVAVGHLAEVQSRRLGRCVSPSRLRASSMPFHARPCPSMPFHALPCPSMTFPRLSHAPLVSDGTASLPPACRHHLLDGAHR
jgi:hypothetical protein